VIVYEQLRNESRTNKQYGYCKGTVGPEASNLSEAEGVHLKLLKLLKLTDRESKENKYKMKKYK
jgi:hypothetical protein